jgi:hypothetical protein
MQNLENDKNKNKNQIPLSLFRKVNNLKFLSIISFSLNFLPKNQHSHLEKQEDGLICCLFQNKMKEDISSFTPPELNVRINLKFL